MMEEWPSVSLTICTFNGEKYLEQTLASIAGVVYPKLEIVIVDDGSTDGTRSLLERFAAQDGRVRLVWQENRGLAAARNRAFAEASGDWLAVLDQDDLIYPQRLLRQAEVAKQFPDTGLIFCNTHYIDCVGKTIGEHLSKFRLPPNHIRAGHAANLLLRQGCFIDSEAWFFRRDAFLETGMLDESLRYACDYDYFIRLGLNASFAYTTEVLGAWRLHANQATATSDRRYAETRRVWLKHLNGTNVDLSTKLVCVLMLARSYASELRRRLSR